MSAGTPAPNLTTLVNRITGDTVEHVLELEKSNSWLEAFLEQWIADEESFFAIALEKEELDMYKQAIDLHLIGGDELTPRGHIVTGYMRPSAIRHVAKAAQVREVAEQEEANNLKERRKKLRQSLARTNRLLDSMSSKLANIKLQVDEADRKVANLSRECDLLISECTEATVNNAKKLSAEFDSSNQPTAVLQKISASLQEKYQFIKRLSNDPLQTGTTSQEFHQASWLLSRAFQNLEDRMYREELLKILATFENGSPVLGELVEQDTLSASTIAATRLQNAWIQDELIKLSYREDMLRTTSDILRTHILPPLILLYVGLMNLQVHISNVHAQCVVLVSELERFASAVQEAEPQAQLDEQDDLLIRLSTLLQLDPDEHGELSAEAILEKLAIIKQS